MPELSAFMSRSTLAGQLDCAESTVDTLVTRGVLPKPIRLSPGVVRWRWADVEAAIMSLGSGANPDAASDPYLAGVAHVAVNKSEEECRDVS
jgi:predicted DNA-binding transcriptional regulator AlpA